jgi:hypothetical protein
MQSHHVAAFTVAAVLITIALATSMAPAAARGGGHGFHRGGGFSGHGAHLAGGGRDFAGDRRHADDPYVKAAEQENDKLLATKLKSICRGC